MRGTCERDGYGLHYEVVGHGPRIVWVDPALGSSAMRPLEEAIEELALSFEVITYDRRGRGLNASSPGPTPAEEAADLCALVDHVGGAAAVVGFSSGGGLVLHAAPCLRVRCLVLVEPAVDTEPDSSGLREVISDHLARGDEEAAVSAFYSAVGLPEEVVQEMAESDVWPGIVRAAGTLLTDIDLSVVDDDVIASVALPVHVIVSTGSPDEIVEMGEQVARRLDARLWKEPGGWHGVEGSALAARLEQVIGS